MAGKIGILTGGGDVPGLNSVIKTVVYQAARTGSSGRRNPQRMGRTHACQLRGSGQRQPLRPAAGPAEHAHHRSHRRHVAAQLAHESAEDEKGAGVSDGRELSRGAEHEGRRDLDGLRHDVAGDEKHREAGTRLSGGHRRRRHAELRGASGPRGDESGRGAENDGQRCAQHRILHRVFDGGDPRDATRWRGSARRSASHERIGVFRCSDAMRATRRSTRRMPARCAAAFRNTRSSSTGCSI